MSTLNLKPNHKVVKAYYDEIKNLSTLNLFSEGSVSPAFANLLRYCAHQFDWTLAEKYKIKRGDRNIFVDGALIDTFKLAHGVWEAKDTDDDLEKEVKKKFDAGYPKDNTLFQAPDRAIIWQNGQEVLDGDISKPEYLVEALKTFFQYQPPEFEQWQQAVEEFKLKVPELAAGVLDLIEKERRTNRRFIQAFEEFTKLCREAINPNISIQAVEEMLIQHLLTERIFRKVFNNPDFVERNVIAHEIDKVIQALTSPYFSRNDFLKSLDRFYGAIETTAATIDDFSQKQSFLNTVYEKFFQGFSVKVADTHGIVYTPQPIVNFMVKSVENILQMEFGRSLSDEGVHILDPFVGTGNFIVHIMREIKRSKLSYKYADELHCNEVMLLPYYIASMNIEHEYYELTHTYQPFEGICLVDTFELAEAKLPTFSQENTNRLEQQKNTPIFVIIANPPYNAGQVNENDNNKNRKHPVVDGRVAETYAKDSKASDKSDLSDPYVKAFRWASDRLGEEGIIAFVTNNSFIEGIAFDGMRKNLSKDFDAIYIMDLGGNVRKNPKLSGTTHNVFGIQIGVGINIFFRKKNEQPQKRVKIYYAKTEEFWRKEQKYDFLDKQEYIGNIEWEQIKPDEKQNWLTKGMEEGFKTLLAMGTKEAKGSKGRETETIFTTYSLGANTNRDIWAYNYNSQTLEKNIRRFIETYNSEVDHWHNRTDKSVQLDDFVLNDKKKIKWSSRLKECLLRYQKAKFSTDKVRNSLYRPFCFQYLFFDEILTHRQGRLPIIFPTPETEAENRMICVSGIGSSKPFQVLMTNIIPCLDMLEKTQCFPFYIYGEDGSDRQENIADWALERFRTNYKDDHISKWDIFHCVYAILHHPQYCEKYKANLRRELPRIPFASDFWKFAEEGKKLAELHVNYEDQLEYPLRWIENKDVPLNWRVEKMKLSKDKTQIIYNDFLTLGGIPIEVFEYRLGNRSALEWIIDQYQVKTEKRSGITNDPNRPNDPEYIVRLIGKVVTVSLETMKIVKGLPELR
jgi:predicted helicase